MISLTKRRNGATTVAPKNGNRNSKVKSDSILLQQETLTQLMKLIVTMILCMNHTLKT